MSAGEELDEVVEAYVEGDRQADGGPHGIAAADPVPELEHVGSVDAEILDGFRVGGKRDKVPGNGRRIFGSLQEPCLGTFGVGHGLLGREGLRGDDKEDGFGVHFLECLGDVGAINVGDEMNLEIAGVRFEGLGRHDRAEIRAADADVDDIGDGFAGITFPRAGADVVAECLHLLEHAVDIGHDILAVNHDRAVRSVAQGNMKHGPAFGDVDLLAGEHLVDPGLEVARRRQGDQQRHGLIGDAVLGVIEKDVVELDGKLSKPPDILGEQVAHLQAIGLAVMGLEDFVCRQLCQTAHCWYPLIW